MDDEQFREELGDLLAEASEDVSTGTMAGVLTAYVARLRGEVRVPLAVEPERAVELREELDGNVGDEVEFEAEVTEQMLAELELQLATFAAAASDEE